MGITVLGPLSVGEPERHLNPRDRVILCALAMTPGRIRSAEELADALWGEDPPASWSKNLQGCIVRLRKALGHDAITTVPGGYRLVVGADDVDAAVFERLAHRGRELLALGEPERAAYHLGRALALWRGRPLVELEAWPPGLQEAERLAELHLQVEDLWLEARLGAGGHRDVVADAEAFASAAPTRERRWQMLALAQYRSGQQPDALETVRRARRTLADEFGLDPGEGLAEVEQAILRHDPDLLVPAAPPVPDRACPYMGLAAYDVEDAELFFGRDAAVGVALERLETEGVLVVVGPSGCGKSSLVRAGVVPRLRREGLRVTLVTPGPHPVTSLTDALTARRGGPQALVVDQAEEVFTLCGDAEERTAFWRAVAEHAGGAPVVLSLRADRMGDTAGHPELAALVERGLMLLAAMEPAEIRTAVTEPARQAGLVVEPGLVDLLIRELEGRPGALPLLSHAMRESWRRREGRSLTVDGYVASGGIRGAVAQSAEGVYARIDPEQRDVLRDLMLRLVVRGAEGQATRSRLPRRLVTDSATEALVEVLLKARLLTTESDAITLAHEALAQSWPRLHGWLEDDATGLRILHHLSAASEAWDTLGRPDSELYRGLRLTETLEWAGGPHPELTAVEADFLAAGRGLAEREQEEAHTRARAQARLIRRLRCALGAAAVMLALSLVAGGVALWQVDVAGERRAEADASTRAARASAIEAIAGRAGARALSVEDIDTSLLLAATAAQLHESAATRGNLLSALAQHPQLLRSTSLPGSAVLGLATSPDGRHLAAYHRDGRVDLLDARSSRLVATHAPASTPRSREQVAPVAFHPAGRRMVIGTPILSARPVRLLDATTLRPRAFRLPGTTGPGSATRDRALSLEFSRDGSRLAGTFHRLGLKEWPDDDPTYEVLSASLMVWDTTDVDRPRLLLREPLVGRTFESLKDREVVALSPDGRRVYVSRPLSAYDVGTGRQQWRTGRNGYVLDLSPDGSTLAVDATPDVLLVDAATGLDQRRLVGHTDDVWTLRFDPTGRRLASAADDGTGIVWNVRSGAVVERLRLGESDVRGLSFTHDGSGLVTGGSDQMIRWWDVVGRAGYVAEVVPPGPMGLGWVAVSPDGRRTAHMVAGKGTFFMDARTGSRTPPVGPREGFAHGEWTRDGRRFASVAGSRVALWSRAGERIADNRAAPLEGRGVGLAFSRDETRLVVSQEDGVVLMLDADTLEPVGRPVDVGLPVAAVSAGPGELGAFALVGGPEGPAYDSFEFQHSASQWAVLDLGRGEVVRMGRVPDAWWGALSPDGATAVVGTFDGHVRFLDVATGEAIGEPREGHATPCCNFGWSPDSTTVVGASYDGRVSLWDARTGELMGRAELPEVSPAAVAIQADGRTVTVGTYTDGVYRWDTGVERALDVACARAGRNLTEREWRASFGDQPYRRTCSAERLDADRLSSRGAVR